MIKNKLLIVFIDKWYFLDDNQYIIKMGNQYGIYLYCRFNNEC